MRWLEHSLTRLCNSPVSALCSQTPPPCPAALSRPQNQTSAVIYTWLRYSANQLLPWYKGCALDLSLHIQLAAGIPPSIASGAIAVEGSLD